MRRPNVLNLDLTATAMLRPSTFGYPIDFASGIDFHPSLRCTCMYTCHPSYARWWSSPIAGCARWLSSGVLATSSSGTVWWNGGVRRRRAHHQHSAAPLAEFQKEFVRKSGSGSTSVGRGWEDMILSGLVDPCNWVDPRYLGQIIAVPWVKFDNCSPGALRAASCLYWWMHFTALRSSTSGMLIVCGRGSWLRYDYPPLFKCRCSADD